MKKIILCILIIIFNVTECLNVTLKNNLSDSDISINIIYNEKYIKSLIIGSMQEILLQRKNDFKSYNIQFKFKNSELVEHVYISQTIYDYAIYKYYIENDGIYICSWNPYSSDEVPRKHAIKVYNIDN